MGEPPAELNTIRGKGKISTCSVLSARCVVATFQLQCVLGLFNEVTQDWQLLVVTEPVWRRHFQLLIQRETIPTPRFSC